MKKILSVLVIGLCLTCLQSYAEDSIEMTFDEFSKKFKEREDLSQQTEELVSMLDVNSDKKVSQNEINMITAEINNSPKMLINGLNEKEFSEYILNAFKQCDKDLNNELTGKEIDELAEKLCDYSIKAAFNDLDKNHDGVINDADMPTPEEKKQQLEEAKQQFKEKIREAKNALDEFENMDIDKIMQNWVESMMTYAADEDFYQMDKDKNKCVNQEEYVNYKLMIDANNEEDDGSKGTAEDYSKEYKEIEKLQNECLRKEEYIAFQTSNIDELFKGMADRAKNVSENIPDAPEEKAFLKTDEDKNKSEYVEKALLTPKEEDFLKMDEDENNCVSMPEYVSYRIMTYDKDKEGDELKKSISYYSREYEEIIKLEKNCLTKDEYVTYLNNKENTKRNADEGLN